MFDVFVGSMTVTRRSNREFVLIVIDSSAGRPPLTA